jgi:hypothetical protein
MMKKRTNASRRVLASRAPNFEHLEGRLMLAMSVTTTVDYSGYVMQGAAIAPGALPVRGALVQAFEGQNPVSAKQVWTGDDGSVTIPLTQNENRT